MPIVIKKGDATAVTPRQKHGAIIAHIVNCEGAWGGGFVLALNKMSPIPKAAYKAWKEQSNGDIPLGEIQFVEVAESKFVVNMCAQVSRQPVPGGDRCLVNYPNLERCLKMTFLRALRLGYSVSMPANIGSGLAGGERAKIHGIIAAVAKQAEQGSKFAEIVREHTGQALELDITLWEFTDTNADSYVPPATDADLGAVAPDEGDAPTGTTTDPEPERTLTADADDIANS